MSDLSHRIANLSPELRARLENHLLGLATAPAAGQAIPRRASSQPAPLSFAQQRLWFLEQLEPTSPLYNISAAVRLRGVLTVEALARSLEAIVARHEALRTTFTTQDGTPIQVIAETRPVHLPVIDLAAHADGEREVELQRILDAEARRPFDLSRDLMLRATLVRLGGNEHVLLLTLHHIAADGWSLDVLYRELANLYGALAQGLPISLPTLPIQYADYAVWQRQWLQGDVLEAQLAYWRQQLGDVRAALTLPTDRPRPAVQTFRGAHRTRILPRALRDALEVLSRREGVTLFMTLLAAFQTLLHRYTAQADIVVGAPIAGRTRVETEGLIGFFVNTLALRTDVSGNPTFREMLARVREGCLGAYAHQEVPFEKLVEELNPERNLSQSPLFQVMFAFQNFPRVALSLPGLTVTPLRVESGMAKFDLTLFMTATEDGLAATAEYNTDLFEAPTVDRMLGHLQVVLEGVATDPDQRLASLPLLGEAERHQLLFEWNDTRADYPAEACVHHLVEAQVERTPDAVAVVCDGQEVTYRELNRQANCLAHHLRTLGVGAETLVAICLERSLDMVVGLLGILKAGGAYVPLDPGYPKERLTFMLEDSQASVLLTQARLQAGLLVNRAQVVCLDTDWAGIAQQSQENPANGAAAENLAYVIYTSGSTGLPKGVAMSHRPLVNLLWWHVSNSSIAKGGRTLQYAPFSFDVSFQELFTTWCTGGTLVLATEEVRRDPRQLVRLLAEEQVTRVFLPPTALETVAEALADPSLLVPPLREVITAGEQLRITRNVVALFTRLGNARLHNHYGPTESHVATQLCLAGPPDGWPVLPPIGRPIANTQMYILDVHRLPVPFGIPGELYIGGAGLARGYVNRPALTAERFIPNPFGDKPGARLYKSGDVARYLPDGTIEFLGRVDFQVKIRGFRVELGEIEIVLGQHPAVRQCVVLAGKDGSGRNRLVAYVVPDPGTAPTISNLRAFLQQKVPEYMVPSAFVLLASMPLTPNGKVDRNALPPPDSRRPDLDNCYVPPRNLTEEKLADIWCQILGLRQVGINDNFFDLGGHSLLGLQVIARLQEAFQIDLPVRSLFESPTITGLAARIDAALGGEVSTGQGEPPPWSILTAIQPGGSRSALFFVPGGGGGEEEFLVYAKLARELGLDYPFYGLRARGADGIQKPHTCVEEMAADYLKEIRAFQPEGPYCVAGECGGGSVAYEMAQQLQAQGQEVGLLVLMDSPRPTKAAYLTYRARRFFPVLSSKWYAEFVERIVFHWRELRQLERRNRLVYIADKVGKALRMVAHGMHLTDLPEPERRRQMNRHVQIVRASYGRCLLRYRPQPYRGRIHMLVSEEFYGRNPTLGWQRLVLGGIDVHRVPGNHLTYIREHVRAAAMQLRACLDSAVAGR